MPVGEEKNDILASLRYYVPICRQDLLNLPLDHSRQDDVKMMLTTIDIFEAEILCEMQDWDDLTVVIEVGPVEGGLSRRISRLDLLNRLQSKGAPVNQVFVDLSKR